MTCKIAKFLEIKTEFETKFLEAARIAAVKIQKKKLVRNNRNVCYELVYHFTQVDIFKIGYEFARLV